MKEQLTLEHLAPYLPYGLTCQDIELWEGEFQIMTLVGVDLYLAYFDRGENYTFEKVRPILHPLSDLTKEIEVNGEKFVPWNKLADYLLDSEPDSFDNIDSAKQWVQTYFLDTDVLNLPYKLVKKLYEWHFDVNSLIDKGIAIDFNALK